MTNRKVISGQAGRYDEMTERLMRDLKADAVVLIVRNGRLGDGFSCAVDPHKPGGLALATGYAMPDLLRHLAAAVEAGINEGPSGVSVSHEPEGNAPGGDA